MHHATAAPVDLAAAPVELEPAFTPRNPYKGLHAFHGEDADDFFGRERLIAELLTMVGQHTDMAPRYLAILGPSGSGKSSVLLAGVLPRLREGALPGSEAWTYVQPLTPGAHPLESLAIALNNALPGSSLGALRADLDDSPRGLHMLAGRLVRQPAARVVLVIDQFEELFTLAADEAERQHFIDLLVTAVSEPRGPLLVLLTLRADFMDRPMSYPTLVTLMDTHSKLIPPMGLEDLRSAIEKPAALPDVRLHFEGDLVGDLLFEVRGQAGALPLLQFTLDQLVTRRTGHLLTRSAYRDIGGVKGALARHAEGTFARLSSEEHRALARALFLRLIDPGATEQDTTRRRAALSELELPDARETALMRAVADAFIAARLLVTTENGGLITLEVSHEALIREWGRLADWLHEAREDIRMQQAISADAAEWGRRDRPSDNLYRGTLLGDARAWAARNRPSAEEWAFVEAGAAEHRRQEEAEQVRQVKELHMERRAANRLRYLAGVLGLFLVVAALLTAVAASNASQARHAEQQALSNAHIAVHNAQDAAAARATAVAERNVALTRAQEAAAASARALAQRNVAVSRQLAAQALSQTGNQRDLALLLAMEAHRVADTTEARYSLLKALESTPLLLTVLRGHTDSVSSVAFSPDGMTVAAGSADNTIRLWDVATGRPRGAPLASSSTVESVAFGSRGQSLVAADTDSARIWNVAGGSPRASSLPDYRGYGGGHVMVSPDGRIVAAGSSSGIQVWDVARGQEIGPPYAIGSVVMAIVFRRDGTILAAATNGEGALQVADVTHRKLLGPPLAGRTFHVKSAAFSPDGKTIAAGGDDNTTRIWDVASGKPLGQGLKGASSLDTVTSVAFSPDGTMLATSGADYTIRLWDVASGELLGPVLDPGGRSTTWHSALTAQCLVRQGQMGWCGCGISQTHVESATPLRGTRTL